MVRRSPQTDGGERVPLQCRSTALTRDRLEEAARQSGRSLSQEMEARLDQSLYVVDAAKKSGELVLSYLQERDELLHMLLGTRETVALLIDIAMLIQGVEGDGQQRWFESPKLRAQVFKTLEAALPELIRAPRGQGEPSAMLRAVELAKYLPERPAKPKPQMPEGMRFMSDEELHRFFYLNEDNKSAPEDNPKKLRSPRGTNKNR